MLVFSLFNLSQTETILFGVLVIDLGVFNKEAHKVTTKSALYQSVFWVFISTLFGFFVYLNGPYVHEEGGLVVTTSGADASIEYFSAYLTEYALSVDNIFV